jgi:hypothetical protein
MQWPYLVMPVVYFLKNGDTARIPPPSARMRFILFVFTFKHHSPNFDYHCTATPRDILQQHVGKRKTQSSRLDSMHLPEEEESEWQGCR